MNKYTIDVYSSAKRFLSDQAAVQREKKQLFQCLIYTFFWGLLAHGYQFLNSNFSHDSLDGFYGGGREAVHKIELGRFGVPLYRYFLRGWLETPWIIGILGLLWLGLALWCISKVFPKIRNRRSILFFTAGILSTNLTVTAVAATYMHDFDCNMLALMFATLAVLLWKSISSTHHWKAGILPLLCGIAAIALSLSIYQSYVSVAITLILIVLILELLDGADWKRVFQKGCTGALMLLLGGIAYGIALKASFILTDVEPSTAYNSLSVMEKLSIGKIPELVFNTYRDWGERFFHPSTTWLLPEVFSVINALICLFVFVLLAVPAVRRCRLQEGALLFCFAALLPLGMNICYVLTSGMVHDLMRYANCFVYLLAILLLLQFESANQNRINPAKRVLSAVIAMMLFATVWSGVQTANVAYLKKELDAQAELSRMTRISMEMDQQEGYIREETPVVFVGMDTQRKAGFEGIADITGMGYTTMIPDDHKSYNSYFRYYLNDPINAVSLRSSMGLNDVIENMPVYPTPGYIRLENGILIVKVG